MDDLAVGNRASTPSDPKGKQAQERSGKVDHATAMELGGMAGAPGFEPGDGGIKIRCLTSWLRPNLGGADHIARAVLVARGPLTYPKGAPKGREPERGAQAPVNRGDRFSAKARRPSR